MVVGGGAPGLDLRRAAPGPPPQRRLPAAPPNESTIWSEEEARRVCASAVLLQVHLYSAGVLPFPPSPPFLVCIRIPPSPPERGSILNGYLSPPALDPSVWVPCYSCCELHPNRRDTAIQIARCCFAPSSLSRLAANQMLNNIIFIAAYFLVLYCTVMNEQIAVSSWNCFQRDSICRLELYLFPERLINVKCFPSDQI